MKRPLGNILVPYGTPLHATELFVQLLKITYADTPKDYIYHYDETSLENSGIAVDVSLNKESEIYGKRPILVVSRGAQSTQPTMVGDIAAVHLPSHTRAASGLATSAINIGVVSRNKAEVEILGQQVFSLCMLCRTHLPNLLGIHMVHNVSLTEVSRYDDDDAMYSAYVNVVYSVQYKWTQSESAEILNSIASKLTPKNPIDKKPSSFREWDGPIIAAQKAEIKPKTLVQAAAANVVTPSVTNLLTPPGNKNTLTTERTPEMTKHFGSFGSIF